MMPTSEVYAIGECHVGGVTPFNVKGGAKSAVFGYEDGEMVATVYTEKADCSGASTSVTMKGDCSVAAKGDEHYGYSSKWYYTEEMPEAAASASTQQAKKASTSTKTLGTYGCSPCKTTSDCEAGFTCVDNKCHPPATAPMFMQMGALDKKTHPFDIMQAKYGMTASAPASKKAVPAPKDLKKEGKRADGDRRFVHVSMASSCGRAPTMSAGAQLDTCVDGRVLSCANGQVVDTKYAKADCSGKASAAVVATEGCAKHPQVADTHVNVACGALDAVPGHDQRTKRDGPGGYDVWAIFADEGTCDVKVHVMTPRARAFSLPPPPDLPPSQTTHRVTSLAPSSTRLNNAKDMTNYEAYPVGECYDGSIIPFSQKEAEVRASRASVLHTQPLYFPPHIVASSANRGQKRRPHCFRSPTGICTRKCTATLRGARATTRRSTCWTGASPGPRSTRATAPNGTCVFAPKRISVARAFCVAHITPCFLAPRCV